MRTHFVGAFAACFAAIAAGSSGPAAATPKPYEPKKTCGSLDGAQQLILERRAIGGDKAAQVELARCAEAEIKSTPPIQIEETKLSYAYLWTAVAYCDRFFNSMERELEGDPVAILKRYDWVSKRPDERRPGGDPTQSFRRKVDAESVELREMWARVSDAMTQRPKVAGDAQKALVRRLAGLGPSGLVALGTMRSCPAITGVDPRLLEAAYWVSASDAFKSVVELGRKGGLADLVPPAYRGIMREDDATLVDEVRRRFGLLGSPADDRRQANAVSLGRMGEAPVQYFQLALGAFRDRPGFASAIKLQGPYKIDNVYGETTSRLVRLAQTDDRIIGDVVRRAGEAADPGNARSGATGYLTPIQGRALICRAATERNDPFSYLHLAQMFANGAGYPLDYDRALFSVQRARRLFDAGPPDYPSNYGDLRGLIAPYQREVVRLEADIYAKAARELLTRTGDVTGAEVDRRVRGAIDARVAQSDYDRKGVLCPDDRGFGEARSGRTPPPKQSGVESSPAPPPPGAAIGFDRALPAIAGGVLGGEAASSEPTRAAQ